MLQISPRGQLSTSTVMGDGWASDKFFYVSPTGRRLLPDTGWDGGGMIWNHTDGGDERFFIGTEQQLHKAEKATQGAIPDGPLDPSTLLPLNVPR